MYNSFCRKMEIGNFGKEPLNAQFVNLPRSNHSNHDNH